LGPFFEGRLASWIFKAKSQEVKEAGAGLLNKKVSFIHLGDWVFVTFHLQKKAPLVKCLSVYCYPDFS
jgi:hypothetical protein